MSTRRGAQLAFGLFSGALGVLLLNDWWLKRAPSALTGKLSDLGGLFLVPLPVVVVASLLSPERQRRLVTAVLVVVAAVFVVAKLDGGVARALGAVWPWPGHAGITADPTDLLCLPMLAVGAWCAALLQPVLRSGRAGHGLVG